MVDAGAVKPVATLVAAEKSSQSRHWSPVSIAPIASASRWCSSSTDTVGGCPPSRLRRPALSALMAISARVRRVGRRAAG